MSNVEALMVSSHVEQDTWDQGRRALAEYSVRVFICRNLFLGSLGIEMQATLTAGLSPYSDRQR